MVSRAPSPRRRAEAEAAAWIARLNADRRDAGTEAALRAWLDASADHRDAFERATEIWGVVPGAMAETGSGASERPLRVQRPVHARAMALAASLLLLLVAGATWWALNPSGRYATSHGEQEVATLEDGSRISLNTDTALNVRYAEGVRRVRLDHGEAMFEVAPDAERPFEVEAGTRLVRALGTSFIVRREGEDVQVVLIEGRVEVEPIGTEREASAGRPGRVELAPGERLIARARTYAAIDRPSIEAATAWRHGQALFEDIPLAEAAAELNRYGGPNLVIVDPRVASLRVSGVFATHDSGEFAEAVATLHGLRIERRAGELRIGR